MGILRDLLARATPTPGASPLPADVTSHAMHKAIRRWYRLYYNDTPSPGFDPSARLAYTVVTRLVRTVFSEYTHSISGGASGLCPTLERLNTIRSDALMHAMIGGEALLKPVISGAGLDFVLIRRPAYRILGRDVHGNATGYATIEVTHEGANTFTLLEERRLQPNGLVCITSRLYRSRTTNEAPPAFEFAEWGGTLGTPVPLSTLPKYSQLTESLTLPRTLGGCGLVPLKMPLANCVDGSPDGVSIYAAAASTIEAAAILEAALNREFTHATSRIIASRDMLRTDPGGSFRLDEDLFIALDDDPTNVGITVFNPAIRDKSYLERKNDYLRTVENIIGLNRGILSKAEAVQRTATEISSTEGEYNLTVQQLQESWRTCVQQLVQVCQALGEMYLGWPCSPPPQLTLDFGDGVLFNRQTAWQEYERMVNNGWLRPEVAVGWYFGIDPTNTAALQRLMPKASTSCPCGGECGGSTTDQAQATKQT